MDCQRIRLVVGSGLKMCEKSSPIVPLSLEGCCLGSGNFSRPVIYVHVVNVDKKFEIILEISFHDLPVTHYL
jgi:hypothetical protein